LLLARASTPEQASFAGNQAADACSSLCRRTTSGATTRRCPRRAPP